jgi:tetratricopeptide (TPR) repeat protein
LYHFALALALVAPSLAAQKAAKPTPIPLRPQLDVGADTNDAALYYRYGMRMVNSKPAESVRAFYWASQIDPSSGEVMYALRAATLMAMDASDLVDYFDNSNKKRPPKYLALDSLLYRAYTVNPFLFRSIDQALIRRLIEARVVRENPSIDRAELNSDILEAMHEMHDQGWLAYAEARLPDALADYAKELNSRGRSKKAHKEEDSEIHSERARIFYLMGNMDSARTEMTAALEAMRVQDSKEVVLLYESKAMYEQSLGMIHEQAKHPDEAREAYGQALTEDLSYYAAHSRMAELELAKGDTAGAVTELDLAVQLQPNDPVLRYAYARALVEARHDAEAATQLLKAIALDQYFAAPHFLLARIADAEQYTDDAVTQYGQFAAMAAKVDPDLPTARDRLAKLTAVAAAPKP